MNRTTRHHRSSLIGSLLAVVIAGAAVASIFTLRHSANVRREAQEVLGRIDSAASRQTMEAVSLLGLGLAGGASNNESTVVELETVREKTAQLRQVVQNENARLATLGLDDARIAEALVQVTRLEEEVGSALDLAASGDYAAAYIYGLRRIKPTYERVEDQMAVAFDGLEAEAAGARRLGDAGGIAALGLAAALLFVLRRRLDKQRSDFHEQLRHEALHDPLTELPNRRLFNDRVGNVCRRRRAGHKAAVLYIDLDGFKAVNDSMGHDAGDRVLTDVAHRLRSCVRSGDTAARMGGDEFAILLPDVGRPVEVTGLANRILEALAVPVHIAGSPARIGASVGIALLGDHAETADQLCNRADQAMYDAKRSGKGAYRVAAPPPAPNETLRPSLSLVTA